MKQNAGTAFFSAGRGLRALLMKERDGMDRNIIVYESCRNIRALGRYSLAGKWKLGVLGTLLYSVLITVPVFILDAIFGEWDSPSAVSSIYSLLITGPMILGYSMFAISIFRNRETSPAEVFYGFERFGKALALYLLISLFIILWAFPVYLGLPAVIFFMGPDFLQNIANGNIRNSLLPLFVLAILCIPAYIAYFRYSMSYYILADNPGIGPLEAIRRSKEMMKGNKWKLFCLYLSFIGWAVLSIFTLFIGFLWLTPYIEVSKIAFYDLANGSLRPVKSIEGEAVIPGSEGEESPGPITVYGEKHELAEPFDREKPESEEPFDGKQPEPAEPENGRIPESSEPESEEPKN